MIFYMSDVKVFMPSLLEIAPNAIEKLRSLKVEECDDSLKLRIFVTGGGCSGLQYGFSFDGASVEDDTLISRHGVDVLIDSMSLPYLVGSTVDYEQGLMGSRFIVANPNAQTTCGCGSSFSI